VKNKTVGQLSKRIDEAEEVSSQKRRMVERVYEVRIIQSFSANLGKRLGPASINFPLNMLPLIKKISFI